jgi:hypothetical protein
MPRSRYAQTILPSERKPYDAYPNSHIGTANSADLGVRLVGSPSGPSR